MLLKVKKVYTYIIEVIVCILIIVPILSITYGILSRNFTFIPIYIWTEELARFCMIGMVFVVAGLSVRYGMHLGFDLLSKALSIKWNRILVTIINSMIIVVLSIVAFETVMYAQVAGFRTSPALKMPMSIAYFVIAIGLILIVIELIFTIISKWKEE
ncbi:TRAP transporter small permease [Halalkalibacter oceani]|uniref:TRAP transporter small permease n=1 Tax=Halalkalibacter oceani TaxID=1653776 RepID=UPI003391EDF8